MDIDEIASIAFEDYNVKAKDETILAHLDIEEVARLAFEDYNMKENFGSIFYNRKTTCEEDSSDSDVPFSFYKEKE